MVGKYNPEKHHRRTIRLKGYNYSWQGAYFVTICTRDQECIFGDIIDREIRLNGYGEIVYGDLQQISKYIENVELDYFIVMPNHIHAILIISGNACRGGVSPPMHEMVNPIKNSRMIKMGGTTEKNRIGKQGDPQVNKKDRITWANQGGETPPLRRTLGQIVAYYKYQTTKQINRIRNTPGIPVWQRNYYDHIIRNDYELNRIRQYILNNPLQWDNDENNPINFNDFK